MSTQVITSQHSTILVTGVGGPAGICAIKYLQLKGYIVIGTDMRTVNSPADNFYEIPAATDKSFMQVILKIIRDHKVSLLIPTVSEELPVIARNKSAFESLGCQVMIGSCYAVDIANDKLETIRFLKQHNVATPKTLTAETTHITVFESIGLPLIAKPRISRGGRGVERYTRFEELEQEHRNDIIYQQFVNGDEYNINLYINHLGNIQSCVVLRKTQLKSGIIGNALKVERAQNTSIANLGRQACTALGLTGPVDIDIRLNDEGTPLLLEINARLGANVLSATEVIDDLIADWQKLSQPMEIVS